MANPNTILQEIDNEIKLKQTRNFTIVNPDQTESGTYTGKQPRQAALKAIKACGSGTKEAPIIVRLREKGTKKINVFKGYTEMVKSPDKRPAWMKETIKKSFAEKCGVEEVIITDRADQGVVITETKKVN